MTSTQGSWSQTNMQPNQWQKKRKKGKYFDVSPMVRKV